MGNSFSIDNRFRSVSLAQFQETAIRLEEALREVRPGISSELFLTTNGVDYCGAASLTVLTPEVEAALDRRERLQLNGLNGKLWKRSFNRELYIKDNSSDDSYMVCLSNGRREPKRLFFYGQGLDDASLEVYDRFRQTQRRFQRIGDGFPKNSDYAVGYALARLLGKQRPSFRFLG